MPPDELVKKLTCTKGVTVQRVNSHWLYLFHVFKKNTQTHTPSPGVAQGVGHHPTNQKVTSLIPGQGTCLGCEPVPWLRE